jgi:hypothetical protein
MYDLDKLLIWSNRNCTSTHVSLSDSVAAANARWTLYRISPSRLASYGKWADMFTSNNCRQKIDSSSPFVVSAGHNYLLPLRLINHRSGVSVHSASIISDPCSRG